jgi:hypothetical protein
MMMPNVRNERKQMLKMDISSAISNGSSPESDKLDQTRIKILF